MKPKALFTSTDVAGFCDADVKTIHNWANAGFPVPSLVQLSAPASCSRGVVLATEDVTVTHVVLAPGERRPEEVHVAQRKRIVAIVGNVIVRTGPDPAQAQELCSNVDFSMGFVDAGVAHTIEARPLCRAEYLSILRAEAT